MRKIFLTFMGFVVTIVSITITSCTKDDQGSTSAKIVGKWFVKSVISHQTYQGVPQHDTTNFTNYYDSYEFNADGTALIKESDTEQNIGWKTSNNKLILGETTAGGDALILNINILTSTTLQLRRVQATDYWTIDQTITLTKAVSQ